MHSQKGAPHLLFRVPWSFTHVVKTKCFQINLPTYQYSKLNRDHVTSEQGSIFSGCDPITLFLRQEVGPSASFTKKSHF